MRICIASYMHLSFLIEWHPSTSAMTAEHQRDVCTVLHGGSLLDGIVHTGKRKTRKVSKMQIKIKYIKDIIPIEKIAQGNWIDLRCAEDTELEAGEYHQIPLGVAMELPKGYEALVVPRSSTFRKYGVLLANSVGVIDESYCGDGDEWCFPAYATANVRIPKNERICQFRIMYRQPDCELVTVESLGNADRGGLGSTGRI